MAEEKQQEKPQDKSQDKPQEKPKPASARPAAKRTKKVVEAEGVALLGTDPPRVDMRAARLPDAPPR